ncbi:MAG: 23S rRNA (guanosine(2251)-2'-O)-methyltransferase RlmB [Deltaproteobacteria bacterium]|nr:23S rRNA (guanosine(2251)-2'-O)-methyltransferase RlmB [Deltaproteobacteria bacterium]
METWDPEGSESWDGEQPESWDGEQPESWDEKQSESWDENGYDGRLVADCGGRPEAGETEPAAVRETEPDCGGRPEAGETEPAAVRETEPRDGDVADSDALPSPGPSGARGPTASGGGSGKSPGDGGTSEVVGINAVAEALEARGNALRRLYVSTSRKPSVAVRALIAKAASLGAPARKVPPGFFVRFAPLSHQGVCAAFDEQAPLSLDDFLDSLPAEGPSLVLALDHISDPGNLGALVRSAWAFGADGAVVPKDRSASMTPVAAKAAAGGLERVKLARAVNLPAALKLLQKKGYWVVAAEASGGEELNSFDFPERTALVLGGEDRGLGRLVAEGADFRVKIPMAGGAESLNVSAAGAVFMFAYRTRFPIS